MLRRRGPAGRETNGRMVRIAPKHNHSFNDELYLEILEAERLREQAV